MKQWHQDDIPVDSRSASVSRKYGWMVDDGTILWMVNNIHGDELGTEREDVQLGTHAGILVHDVLDGLTFDPPLGKLENVDAVILRSSS